MGDKTANLFSKKKDEAEKLAKEKADNAQKMAEEQAKKVGEAVQQTKSEAENLATDTGKKYNKINKTKFLEKVTRNS